MENPKSENPRLPAQNPEKENSEEIKKENNELERPSLIVNSRDRYDDGLQNGNHAIRSEAHALTDRRNAE